MGARIEVPLEDKELIWEAYKSGKSVLSISRTCGYKYDVTHRIIKEKHDIRNNGAYATKYNCNINYFDIIDTEEKAYWLGFIYADGYISKIEYGFLFGLALSSVDNEHLSKFKVSIESSHPTNHYEAKGFKGKSEYSRVVINNDYFCEQLIKKGVIIHKTDRLEFPDESIVPEHLIRHFIRGYFDGDGSITHVLHKKRNVDVFAVKTLGTKEFLKEVHKHFPTRYDKFNPISTREGSNTYSLDLGGNRQVNNILDYLYKDSNIYLDRKYEKYLYFKSAYNSRS